MTKIKSIAKQQLTWQRASRILILTLFFSIPLLLWWQHVGELSLYLSDKVPPGQGWYILSKLTGLYALLMMVWQVIASLWARLARQGFLLSDASWLNLSHRVTGSLIVCFAIAHLALFFAAVTVRQGYPAWSLMRPNLTDYYHLRLTLGLMALLCLIIVAVAGILRHRWRHHALVAWLHKAYIATVILVYWHALAVGSEAQTLLGQSIYWTLGGIMAILVALNVWVFLMPRFRNRCEVSA